jgi:aarF domain-containing kinase
MKSWGHEVSIPRPHLELCSKHILVMEYLKGIKFVDGIRAQYRAIAAQTGDTRDFEVIEKERVDAIRNGTLKLKSLKEAQQDDQSIHWMLFLNNWVLSLNPLRYAYNTTISPVCQILFGSSSEQQWDWKYQFALSGSEGTPFVDLSHLLRVLCDVHAHQIFQGGAFNGDPHPGNILLQPDGKLGLIDYGQVRSFTQFPSSLSS